MASLRRSVLASYPHVPLSLGSTLVIVSMKQISDDIITAIITYTHTTTIIIIIIIIIIVITVAINLH